MNNVTKQMSLTVLETWEKDFSNYLVKIKEQKKQNQQFIAEIF